MLQNLNLKDSLYNILFSLLIVKVLITEITFSEMGVILGLVCIIIMNIFFNGNKKFEDFEKKLAKQNEVILNAAEQIDKLKTSIISIKMSGGFNKGKI